MALVMLAPFILQGISGMTDGMLKKLVVTTTLLNVVFGKYLGVSDGFSLIWFINLFLLGHYFRKTPFRFSSSMLLLAIVVLSILYTVGSFLMVNQWSISSVGKVGTVGVYSNAFCLAISLCIFALFRQRTLSACPASVQWFAESAFAVYLLTECFLVKESIWKLWNWLVLNHAESLLQMIGLQILFCSSLFILCVIIDKFRRLCFRFLRLERA